MVLSKILGGGSLVETVGKVIDSVHTSEEEKLAAKTKLKEIEAELSKKQMDINLADAKSQATGIGGIMQRSWRPLIGMSCALAIAWEFVIKQFLVFVLAAFSVQHNPLRNLTCRLYSHSSRPCSEWPDSAVSKNLKKLQNSGTLRLQSKTVNL